VLHFKIILQAGPECRTAWDRPTSQFLKCNLNQNKLKRPRLSRRARGILLSFGNWVETRRSCDEGLARRAKSPRDGIDRAKDILVLGCVFANAVAQFRIRVGTWRYGLLPKDTRSPVRWRSKRGAWNPQNKSKKEEKHQKHNRFARVSPVRVCECRVSVCVDRSCAVWGRLILLAPRDASWKSQAKHRNTINEKLNIN